MRKWRGSKTKNIIKKNEEGKGNRRDGTEKKKEEYYEKERKR